MEQFGSDSKTGAHDSGISRIREGFEDIFTGERVF
jgi:hypothetical protein